MVAARKLKCLLSVQFKVTSKPEALFVCRLLEGSGGNGNGFRVASGAGVTDALVRGTKA